MSLIGHNRGPVMDEGHSWRRHCWTEARRALLPTLPLEVVRLRVARAREIGLDYRTYATVRATTGQDIVAFLFSSNALRVFAASPSLPADRSTRLQAIAACDRLGAAIRPLTADQLHLPGIDAAFAAPAPFATWRDSRTILRQALAARRLPAEGVLLIGDTDAERDWSVAAALASYLPADRFFAATP
jgi:hypothetical protein